MEKEIQQIRKKIFLGAYSAGIGHVASSMSLVEVLYALYNCKILNVNHNESKNPERDRLILSKGHGSLALYAILSENGYFDTDEMYRFGTNNSMLGGEPILGLTPGVEATTGSLGHGLSLGVGMALALKMNNSNAKVYVVLGDGECQEGSIWEAIMVANKYKLSNLIVLVDNNKLQKLEATSVISGIDNMQECWKSFGWNTYSVDGHDVNEIKNCLLNIEDENSPKVVFCETIKGKGLSFMEGKYEWHYRMPGKKDLKKAMIELDISEEELDYAKSVHKQNI